MDDDDDSFVDAVEPKNTSVAISEYKQRQKEGKKIKSLNPHASMETSKRQQAMMEQSRRRQARFIRKDKECPVKYQKLAKILALSTMVIGLCGTLRWLYVTGNFITSSPGFQQLSSLAETTIGAATTTGSAIVDGASATGSAIAKVDQMTGVSKAVSGVISGTSSRISSVCGTVTSGVSRAMSTITPQVMEIFTNFLYTAGPPLAAIYASKNKKEIMTKLNRLSTLRPSERRRQDIDDLEMQLEKLNINNSETESASASSSASGSDSVVLNNYPFTIRDILTTFFNTTMQDTKSKYKTLFLLWCDILQSVDENVVQKILDPLGAGKLGDIVPKGGKSRRHRKNNKGHKTRKHDKKNSKLHKKINKKVHKTQKKHKSKSGHKQKKSHSSTRKMKKTH